MRKISKNAVVILGNGFDLAHGLKTGYNDFSEWYIRDYIIPELLEMRHNIRGFDIGETSCLSKEFLIKFRDVFYGDSRDESIINLIRFIDSFSGENFAESFVKYFLKNVGVFRGSLKNIFLSKLYSNSYENWFDIENAYFFELERILSLDPKATKELSFDSINPEIELLKLNNEFNDVKGLLKDYLSTIQVVKKEDVATFFNFNFLGKEDVFIVNFNYTDTINQYLKEFLFSPSVTKNSKSGVHNYFIHGNLNSDLTFGYGDDDSEEYKLMKKTGRDEYLENFKTFHYLENNNYRELINVLDGLENYEAYVLGHSLSLTDKTLLNEILSPKKCYNIHLFHRSDISDEDKKKRSIKKLHFNISRILNNDNDSRKRIIPIKLSPHFPHKESDNTTIHKKIESIYEKFAVDY